LAATTERPPGYTPQEARFGERCRDCKFYESNGGRCTKYGVEVVNYYFCDSWVRNPDLPVQAV
jgi:hypothetical protein